jgi:hypothetical protein
MAIYGLLAEKAERYRATEKQEIKIEFVWDS